MAVENATSVVCDNHGTTQWYFVPGLCSAFSIGITKNDFFLFSSCFFLKRESKRNLWALWENASAFFQGTAENACSFNKNIIWFSAKPWCETRGVFRSPGSVHRLQLSYAFLPSFPVAVIGSLLEFPRLVDLVPADFNGIRASHLRAQSPIGIKTSSSESLPRP